MWISCRKLRLKDFGMDKVIVWVFFAKGFESKHWVVDIRLCTPHSWHPWHVGYRNSTSQWPRNFLPIWSLRVQILNRLAMRSHLRRSSSNLRMVSSCRNAGCHRCSEHVDTCRPIWHRLGRNNAENVKSLTTDCIEMVKMACMSLCYSLLFFRSWVNGSYYGGKVHAQRACEQR